MKTNKQIAEEILLEIERISIESSRLLDTAGQALVKDTLKKCYQLAGKRSQYARKLALEAASLIQMVMVEEQPIVTIMADRASDYACAAELNTQVIGELLRAKN